MQSRVPRKDPERVRSGPGLGASCSVSDVPIRQELMEFEVQFTFTRDPNTPPDFDVYHVHPRCYAVWELMRREPKL